MGNDLDVCSRDESLQQYLEQQYGPQNESVFQFVYRTYNKFCDSLIHPTRRIYQDIDLIPAFTDQDERNLWDIQEFDVISQGNRLHCCYWRYKDNSAMQQSSEAGNDGNCAASAMSNGNISPTSRERLCILYFPTNQRALNEALDVFPLAKELKCDVFSLDYAGYGKSNGGMHEQIDIDIENVINHLQSSYIGNYSLSMILWARGMSTALVIMFLSRLTKQQMKYQQWKQQKAEEAQEGAVPKRQSRRWFGKKDTAEATNSAAPPVFALTPPKKIPLSNNRKKDSVDISATNEPSHYSPDPSIPIPVTDKSIFISGTTENWEEILGNKLKILQLIKCIVLDSPFLSIEEMIRAGIEKMHAKGFYLTKSVIYFIIKTIMRNISKRLNGYNIFTIKPREDVPFINYFPCFILSANNDDYIPTTHGELMSKLWENSNFNQNPDEKKENNDVNDDGKEKTNSLNDYFYGNVQFNIVPGRHFPRRDPWIVELTSDFVKAHVLHYSNRRFETNQWYYLLEKQVQESQLKEKERQKNRKNQKEEADLMGEDELGDDKEEEMDKKPPTAPTNKVESAPAERPRRFNFFRRRTNPPETKAKETIITDDSSDTNRLSGANSSNNGEDGIEGASVLHENVKALVAKDDHFSTLNLHYTHTTYIETFDIDDEQDEEIMNLVDMEDDSKSHSSSNYSSSRHSQKQIVIQDIVDGIESPSSFQPSVNGGNRLQLHHHLKYTAEELSFSQNNTGNSSPSTNSSGKLHGSQNYSGHHSHYQKTMMIEETLTTIDLDSTNP